jgi:hypothetical protein
MRPKLKVSLRGGRAEQNRAHVEDLILLLQEFQAVVLEFGRQRAGSDVPDAVIRSSCRLDLVGLTFGSVAPELELANFTEQEPNPLGMGALEDACRVFSLLSAVDAVRGPLVPPSVVDHIDRIGGLLDRGYEKVETTYLADGRSLVGVLDQEFRARFLADEATTLAVEGVSVRGFLFGLEDRPSDREKRFFSGELMDEAGKAWSIRFNVQLADEARSLWRKSVELVGRARYSKMRRPVLYVEHGQMLAAGAWKEALTRHRGNWRRLYQGMSMDDILRDLR